VAPHQVMGHIIASGRHCTQLMVLVCNFTEVLYDLHWLFDILNNRLWYFAMHFGTVLYIFICFNVTG